MIRIKLFLKNIENNLIGISLEILLVYFFIFAGFLVCFIWWAVFK